MGICCSVSSDDGDDSYERIRVTKTWTVPEFGFISNTFRSHESVSSELVRSRRMPDALWQLRLFPNVLATRSTSHPVTGSTWTTDPYTGEGHFETTHGSVMTFYTVRETHFRLSLLGPMVANEEILRANYHIYLQCSSPSYGVRTETLAVGNHRFGRRWFFNLLGSRSYKVDVKVDQDLVMRWLQRDGSLTVVAVIDYHTSEWCLFLYE